MKQTITYMQNENLDGNSFTISGKKDVCVILIHGFTATPVEVKPFAYKLAEDGYTVICPLLPGHNTTPKDLNSKTWMDWTSSVNIILEKALQNYQYVFIGGESMGGLISCYLAARHPSIKGILLFSPALFVPKLNYSKIIKYIKPTMPKNAQKQIKENSEIYPWKGYTVNPTRAANQLFKLQNIVKRELSKIVAPIMIFQGEKDRTIDPQSSEFIYDHVSSKNKELIKLKNSGHCILIDQEFEKVVEYASEFIKKLI